MGGIVGEIEFEFVEQGPGAGKFVATGKVVHAITGHLARNEIREAAGLYQGCGPEVAETLLAEAKLASALTRSRLMELFVRARDHRSAARCAELVDDPAQAAKFFEEAYEFPRAARLYARAGEPARAALMHEKALEFAEAGRLYVQLGDLPRAAENLQRGGEPLRAGQLLLKAGDWKRAGAVLQEIAPDHPDYFSASTVLAELFWRTGHRDLAVARLVELLRACPDRPEAADSYYRLAEMFEQTGRTEHASRVLERLEAFRPDFKDVRVRLDAMRRLSLVPAAPPTPPPNAGAAPTPPPPLDLAAGVAAESAGPVQVMDTDADSLRALPLATELDHTELRELSTLAGRLAVPAGRRILRQGDPGRGLYLVLEGAVEVVRRAEDGSETRLATLGPGEHFGEMSVIDDQPVSADVRTEREALLLAVPREDLLRFLYLNERAALKVYRHFARTLARRLAGTRS